MLSSEGGHADLESSREMVAGAGLVAEGVQDGAEVPAEGGGVGVVGSAGGPG
jgi:hypothetical protein